MKLTPPRGGVTALQRHESHRAGRDTEHFEGSAIVRTARFNVEEVLRSWRGRVGAGATKDGGPRREAREATKHENTYGRRRARQRTEAARERDQRGIAPGADR